MELNNFKFVFATNIAAQRYTFHEPHRIFISKAEWANIRGK